MSKRSKKSKSRSPSKDSKLKSNSLETPELIIPMPFDSSITRATSTDEYCPEKLQLFRCPECKLSFCTLLSLTSHECWRKVYEEKCSLISERIQVCRKCSTAIYRDNYSSHNCLEMQTCNVDTTFKTSEIVIALDSNFHLDFYINWSRRKDLEELREDYQTKWSFELACSFCRNEFKTKFEYIMHSCFLAAKLTTEEIHQLKICLSCKYVFRNACHYEKHVQLCDEKAFMISFSLESGELILGQLIQTRKCYDSKVHKESNNNGISPRGPDEPSCMHPRVELAIEDQPVKSKVSSTCNECRRQFENLEDFILHTCVAGRLVTPANLDSVMFCDACYCLFLKNDQLIAHFKTCKPNKLTFVRINTPRLVSLLLKRWTIDLFENPYLPARPIRFTCCMCSEVFRHFGSLLYHPCHLDGSYGRRLIHPSNIIETFSCQACNRVYFTTHESMTHAKCCSMALNPYMIQIHYDMKEIILALDNWMRCNQLLSMELSLDLNFGKDVSREVDGDGKKCRNFYRVTKTDLKPTKRAAEKGSAKEKCLDFGNYTLLKCNRDYSLMK